MYLNLTYHTFKLLSVRKHLLISFPCKTFNKIHQKQPFYVHTPVCCCGFFLFFFPSKTCFTCLPTWLKWKNLSLAIINQYEPVFLQGLRKTGQALNNSHLHRQRNQICLAPSPLSKLTPSDQVGNTFHSQKSFLKNFLPMAT